MDSPGCADLFDWQLRRASNLYSYSFQINMHCHISLSLDIICSQSDISLLFLFLSSYNTDKQMLLTSVQFKPDTYSVHEAPRPWPLGSKRQGFEPLSCGRFQDLLPQELASHFPTQLRSVTSRTLSSHKTCVFLQDLEGRHHTIFYLFIDRQSNRDTEKQR